MVRGQIGAMALAAVLTAAPGAHAGDDDLVFIDVYGGYVWNQNQDFELEYPSSVGNVKLDIEDVGILDVAGFGGRIGFWFQSNPIMGFAIDATRFDSDVDVQTINGTTTIAGGATTVRALPTQAASEMRVANTFVTFDLIFRQRMGQLTPYITGGAGVAISELDDNGFFTASDADTDHSLAIKAGAGLSWALSDTMEIFGEYRYLYADPEYDLKAIRVGGIGAPGETNRGTLEKDIEAHAVFSGVSIRF